MDTPTISPLLEQLDPASGLSQGARDEVAAQCEILDEAAGKRLRPDAASEHHLFLLSGQLVRVVGGTPERIRLDGEDGDVPVELFEGSPGHQDFVLTEQPCRILAVPKAALERAYSSSVVVSDTELDDTEGAFFSELYDLITSNRLELPTMPEVALRIQELTNDPEASMDDLTEVIQRDGTIAGALLHATNSPLFRGAQQIQSVREAVTRLGFRNTRMLAMNMALRQTFKAKHAATREAMAEVWSEGVLNSAFAYLIADSLRLLDRERALLGGLVAGIGAVPIIQFAEMREENPGAERLGMLIERLRNLAGVLVINYWDLGQDLVAVAEHAYDWSYRAEQPDYASVGIVAEWAALHYSGKPHPDAREVAAFEVLGIDPPAPGDPIPFLEERNDDLNELKLLFNA